MRERLWRWLWKEKKLIGRQFNAARYSLAVHTAKSICIESKKKNITRSEIEAPRGRQSACVVSRVANPESKPRKSFNNNYRNPWYAILVSCCGTGSPVNKLLELSLWRFFSFSRASCSIFRLRKLPYTMRRMEIRHVDTRDPNNSTAIIFWRFSLWRDGLKCRQNSKILKSSLLRQVLVVQDWPIQLLGGAMKSWQQLPTI